MTYDRRPTRGGRAGVLFVHLKFVFWHLFVSKRIHGIQPAGLQRRINPPAPTTVDVATAVIITMGVIWVRKNWTTTLLSKSANMALQQAERPAEKADDQHSSGMQQDIPARTDRHADADLAGAFGDQTSMMFIMPMPPTGG